ncbi:hypothetical protein HMPREF9151_02424 [Hoylesella saccharolytica F0055]|uniref:Uncharacterized protein n=1 Tax=Hoylesella saccharolytica F0055 TaxID=1127699 RepID=L1MZ99_9BACT|nr:hypothetical protein HMPREF9151_02424 [Hoylesella saccharolytica F0055]
MLAFHCLQPIPSILIARFYPAFTHIIGRAQTDQLFVIGFVS